MICHAPIGDLVRARMTVLERIGLPSASVGMSLFTFGLWFGLLGFIVGVLEWNGVIALAMLQ